MSFLSRLFGSKTSATPETEPGKEQSTGELEYKGFMIRAVPFKQNGQFQTAGVIEKDVDGILKTHRFVRADRSTMVEEVTDLALAKGKLMIDQMGDGVFQ